jgi:diguanylate cyclase (GGDEF)-like protein/PAS domain S-box-containing protein
MKNKTLFLVVTIVVTTLAFAIVWEFFLEPILYGGEGERVQARWSYVMTATVFVIMAMIPASFIIRRTERENETAIEMLEKDAMVFENTREGIIITDADGTIETVNPAFTAITGYNPEEAIGSKPNLLRSDRHDKEFYVRMWDALIEKGEWEGEIWNRRKSGEVYPERLVITSIKGSDGQPKNYVGVFSDMSETKSNEEEIIRQAYYDSLTGLANRLLFMDRLREAVIRAGREKKGLAVFFLDLDNFKNVNDTLGHDIGDDLLVEAAKRLTECLREVDTVSRLGGDEFTVLLEALAKDDDVTIVARKVIKALSLPYTLKNEEVFITVSLGITWFPSDGDSAESLVKNADLAMYHAKQLGKNNYQIFNKAMNERAMRRLKLERGLRKAIDDEELVAYYQPKVNLETRRIVGTEALVRWKNKDGSLISPDEFIPLAEETGLIIGIDEWMLHEACAFIKEIHNEDHRDLPVSVNVSVNLSAVVLERKDLVEIVSSTIEGIGLKPEHLELEVTESSVIRNLDLAITTIQRLRDRGFNVSMDDFGTGYSSLSYLVKLPINILKIDRAFVTDLPTSANSRSVARAIVAMAHDMGMKVVAEGVETEEQLNFLDEIGCDEVQGYYFSPPIPKDKFLNLLKENRELYG